MRSNGPLPQVVFWWQMYVHTLWIEQVDADIMVIVTSLLYWEHFTLSHGYCWTPVGVLQQSIRSPPGVQLDFTRSPTGLHQESNRSPPGVHQECTRSSLGVQPESTRSSPGVQPESNWSASVVQLECIRSPAGVQQEFTRSTDLLMRDLGLKSPKQNALTAVWTCITIWSCDATNTSIITTQPWQLKYIAQLEPHIAHVTIL